MKKIITLALVCAVAFVITSCSGSGNEPKAVVEKYITALKKGDFKGAIEYTAYSPEEKEKIVELFEQKAKSEETGELKIGDIKVVDQEIDEEAGTATVTISTTKEDGTTDEKKLSLVKVDDKWLLKDAK